jgi:hypothetical protein
MGDYQNNEPQIWPVLSGFSVGSLVLFREGRWPAIGRSLCSRATGNQYTALFSTQRYIG